ncbi:hypothetical protein L596_017437 [Steinernema carpocapsae]|uniref:Uncharacterized protein n=1 Tax=Steinernema carpocapsae TaxID=34508 RepID=A0A4U5N1N6_STECR|nr:hypothetical protein L596_017437 [Steinernema carpocapsae]
MVSKVLILGIFAAIFLVSINAEAETVNEAFFAGKIKAANGTIAKEKTTANHFKPASYGERLTHTKRDTDLTEEPKTETERPKRASYGKRSATTEETQDRNRAS